MRLPCSTPAAFSTNPTFKAYRVGRELAFCCGRHAVFVTSMEFGYGHFRSSAYAYAGMVFNAALCRSCAEQVSQWPR